MEYNTDTPDQLNIIMVDDDKKLCRLVADYLEPMGYCVDMAHNGKDGLKKIQNGEYSAVILDVMMPVMDGFETLKELRKNSDIPVLMLTARGEEVDRIVGLEMGADDYLPKTFSSRELLARLRAVTRRFARSGGTEKAHESDEMRFGPLVISKDSRTASLEGKLLNLTPVEYDLLLCLSKAAGRIMSRDQLLDVVADRDYEVFDRSIDVHISSLRRKLKEDPKNPRFIKTVRTAGYMFLPQGQS